jgi:hypothetical protein
VLTAVSQTASWLELVEMSLRISSLAVGLAVGLLTLRDLIKKLKNK